MDVVAAIIKKMFSQAIGQEVILGIVEVIHTFGRDLVSKTHVHALATEGEYNSQNNFVSWGRYTRHPAIANSRIIDYNGKGVTFYYEETALKRYEFNNKLDRIVR